MTRLSFILLGLLIPISVSAQALSPELFFSKKKLQKASIEYTNKMEICFEKVPQVNVKQLDASKFNVKSAVKAVNYFHYLTLNKCMKDRDVDFLKAVEHYNQTAPKDELITVDSFVTYRWNEELRSEFEFKQLPEEVQQHFSQLEALQKPFDAAKLVMELLGEL
ncbi:MULTISPECIES: hypothetical protein [unclassified Pseudoalteromonas]|uniref:hypothetical protein n=1 Tax=unclassified Pseudoalteromonas TaxID=194690 RepID=UPI001572B1D9|nr:MULTISPECIES: hypothetical protein [unclassified Pseudoalteromonas]MCX2765376.1 hypothetical protein [Pseudoalteromonas sp. B530]NSY32630.1 hypothetical protein [Pseudoalteromonas sp. JC28]